MSLLKEGWALALMVLSLLFLPQEKLAFWFADRPQDWYGELAIPGTNHEYVLVKNKSPYSVQLRSTTARLLGARSLGGSAVDLGEGSAPIPRDVYVLLAEERRSGPTERRRAFEESISDFAPPQLYIATEAEDDVSIMLLFLGAALMACLGFSIGLFFHEAALALEGNTPASK